MAEAAVRCLIGRPPRETLTFPFPFPLFPLKPLPFLPARQYSPAQSISEQQHRNQVLQLELTPQTLIPTQSAPALPPQADTPILCSLLLAASPPFSPPPSECISTYRKYRAAELLLADESPVERNDADVVPVAEAAAGRPLRVREAQLRAGVMPRQNMRSKRLRGKEGRGKRKGSFRQFRVQSKQWRARKDGADRGGHVLCDPETSMILTRREREMQCRRAQ